jgi:GNAT superfamily N-acetyltransferase
MTAQVNGAMASSPKELIFERATRVAISWADAEGWNPGLDDGERFLAADPYSFLATEREGEIAATVSCALYGDSYAFIGFYIVRSDLRGNGIGSSLFDRALDRANGRVVGLDGVLAQQRSYERRGFVLAYRNVRWRTLGGGERPNGVVELSSVPVEQLVAFDAAVFGAERERFLRAWIDRPAGHALACLRGGRLAGYGVLRPCHAGAKIGPLFADDQDVAEVLLAGLLAAAGPGRGVFIDMPSTNPRAADLRARRALEPSFETARMYLNGRPPEDVERVFGVTTFEFG